MDDEWIALMKEARDQGLTPNQVREVLNRLKSKKYN
ncbi:anti-repressor SinI family protein [Fictibacillus sp. NRS-1165]